MKKRTKAEIEDLKYYANRKDLDPDFGVHCHTKEQIDMVLYIWNEMKENWWEYEHFELLDKTDEYRDSYEEFSKAKDHLKWLETYYKNTDSPNKHIITRLINNKEQPSARKEAMVRKLKEMAQKYLTENHFTSTQKKKILALLIRNFKVLENVPFKVYNPLQ